MLSNEYLAGFFDGEGCVYITPDGRLQVGVTQKNPEVLDVFKKRFGGNIRFKDRAGATYQWTIGAKKDCLIFLNAIYPYSFGKKKEIEVGIKAAERIYGNNLGCCPLPKCEMEERRALREEMQRLRPTTNYRGTLAAEKKYRNAIKEKNGHRCQMCGKDLRGRPLFEQIITSDENLICRKCHPKRFPPNNLKPIAKETIENALANSKSLFVVCDKLGISRATLYDKRKRFGLI